MTKKGGSTKKKGGKTRHISNVKKSNIAKNKLVKAGKLKPKSKPRFLEGGQFKDRKNNKGEVLTAEQLQSREEYHEEKKKQEAEMYQEMISDMMDPEDVAYLKKNANRSKAFNIPTEQGRKRKKPDDETENGNNEEDDDEGFDEYEMNAMKRIKENQSNENSEKKRDLLPVRTSENGWEQRTCTIVDSEKNEVSDVESDADNDNQTKDEGGIKQQKPVSVIGILAKRKELLEESKLQIGSMATNFLENPEERMFLLDRLIRFMTIGQNDASVEKTVIKLAAASVVEILRDIIPNYKIGDHETQDKSVKLKKDTLKLHRFESALLACVKRFLVKCERIVSEDKKSSLAPHAMTCLMELLIAHPQFNFTENIIQFSVAYLNSPIVKLRQTVHTGIIRLFKNDKRGQVSYMAVRCINHHLKSKKREKVRPEMLDVLLSLKMYHLENPKDIATGHLQALAKAGKKDRQEMSKKERKQAKARAILDKEMLEAKAEESTQTRLKFASDVSNLLFAIYFRLIKDPAGGKGEAAIITNRTLLRPVLTGLAKFGHLMSIDYFQDLLRVLSDLLERKIDDNQDKYFLGSHEALLCIHTVLSILSGQGESLTMDPQKFYNHLDRVIDDLKPTSAHEGNNDMTYELASKVLREAFINRRKKISKLVLLQAIKHVGIASLFGGANHLIEFLKECIQTHPTSIGETLMTKDDDVEAQKASVVPRNQIADFTNVEKDPLIWEIAGITSHYDPEIRKSAAEILGISLKAKGTAKGGKSITYDLSLPKDYEILDDDFEQSIYTQGFGILSVK